MRGDCVLVTGATGGVGSLLARRAVKAGYRVRAVVRPTSQCAVLAALGVELLRADLSDPSTLPSTLEGVDIVVHCAAKVGDWGPIEAYRAVNVHAVERLAAAARQGGSLKRWVYLSSSTVYHARHHYGSEESEPVDPIGLDNYARSKAEGELLIRSLIEREGFPAVILRPGIVYGPGDRHIIPRLLEQLATGRFRFIGDGSRVLNNTFVGNLVDAILLAMEKEGQAVLGETFNIRDERLVTRKELIGTLAHYLGKPLPGHVPEWLARMAVVPMRWWALARSASDPPLLTKARIRLLTLNLDLSIAKAKEKLGYQPKVDFRDGIREALAWLERESLLWAKATGGKKADPT